MVMESMRLFLKWSPSNSKRPPQRGFTGNTYLDAYKMDGTRLWRIDLGPNVRSGAATTNFLVFDFDGDGCAEICCRQEMVLSTGWDIG